MRFRATPRTPGPPISILGLGGLRLPTAPGEPGRLDEAATARLLEAAVEAGVTWLDTSPAFHGGRSEPLLGRLLRGGLRERVRLAARFPAWQVQAEGDWDRLLAAQLERLGTDRIDCCLLPPLDRERWDRLLRLGGLTALARARADGRVGALGVTSQGGPDELERLLAALDWDLCQRALDWRDAGETDAACLRLAAARGVGVVVAEPLRGGQLASPPPVVRAAWRASPRPWSPAGWALRWAWDQPGVVTVLSGTRSIAHLLENARAADDAAPLTEEDRAHLAAVRHAWRTRRRVPCECCGVCTVCAAQVPVADLLALYNAGMFEDREAAAAEYRQAFLAQGRGADRCTACGVCLPTCPRDLAIPERLREAHAWLTGA